MVIHNMNFSWPLYLFYIEKLYFGTHAARGNAMRDKEILLSRISEIYMLLVALIRELEAFDERAHLIEPSKKGYYESN